MNHLDQMTISIVSYLEKKPGICQVKNEVKAPAERPTVLMWEQKHSLLLPADLKNFFLSSNGFHLTWSIKMGNATFPVGTMHINSVGQLTRLENGVSEGAHVQPSLWDLDMEEDRGENKVPSFIDSRIFELDPCDGFGKVCLVYSKAPKESGKVLEKHRWFLDVTSGTSGPCSNDYASAIWFLDRSLRWHYICDTFLAYYRLMLMHIGLPHWQFAFTDIGLPPYAKQWYNMYAPVRLEVDAEGGIDVAPHGEIDGKVKTSPLDINKVFKEKSDRSKATGTQNTTNLSRAIGSKKQKPPMSSARLATAVGKQAGQPSSQVAAKSSR